MKNIKYIILLSICILCIGIIFYIMAFLEKPYRKKWDLEYQLKNHTETAFTSFHQKAVWEKYEKENEKSIHIAKLDFHNSVQEINTDNITISLESEQYYDERHNSSIDISYPVISTMTEETDTGAKLNELNQILKEIAFNEISINTIQQEFNKHLKTVYSITYFSNKYISILFYIKLDNSLTATDFFTAITFDLKEFQQLSAQDFSLDIKQLMEESPKIKVSYIHPSLDYRNIEVRQQLYSTWMNDTDPFRNFYICDTGIGLILAVGGPNPSTVLYEIEIEDRPADKSQVPN